MSLVVTVSCLLVMLEWEVEHSLEDQMVPMGVSTPQVLSAAEQDGALTRKQSLFLPHKKNTCLQLTGTVFMVLKMCFSQSKFLNVKYF